MKETAKYLEENVDYDAKIVLMGFGWFPDVSYCSIISLRENLYSHPKLQSKNHVTFPPVALTTKWLSWMLNSWRRTEQVYDAVLVTKILWVLSKCVSIKTTYKKFTLIKQHLNCSFQTKFLSAYSRDHSCVLCIQAHWGQSGMEHFALN